MKKILSLVLVITTILMCSLTAFAATPAMVINAVEDNDGVVTFTVNVTSDALCGAMVRLKLTNLEYVANSFTTVATSFTGWLTTESNLTNEKVSIQGTDLNNTYVANNTTLYTFKYNKTGDWSVEFSGTSASKKCEVAQKENGNKVSYANKDNSSCFTLNIQKASTSTDIIVNVENFDEVADGSFTSKDMTSGNVVIDADNKIEMKENGKIYTYFNKNASGKTLTAGKYGISVVIDGNTYKFPGNANVSATQSWAIKLVLPEGEFKDGTITNFGDVATPYFVD